MTIPIEKLKAMLAGCDKATPGPWYTAGPPWFDFNSGVLAGSPDPHAGFLIVDTETWQGEREEYLDNGGTVKLGSPEDDAAFIASCDPQTMRDLLTELIESREKSNG